MTYNTNIKTVGDLKEMLKEIPDTYELSVTGIRGGMVVDSENKRVLLDEVDYIYELIGG